MPGLVTIGHPDLDLALFVLGWNPDGLSAGRLDYYLVGLAFVVITSFLHSWDLADLISPGLDLDLLGLPFVVSGLDEYLLGVSLVVSRYPLPGAGGVVVIGKAEAQANGRTTMASGGTGSSAVAASESGPCRSAP